MKHSNTKAPQKKTKRKPRPTQAEVTDPRVSNALSALVKHQKDLHNAVLASAPKKNGTFSNLGGDVDSMIEHGQEAWASVRRLLNTESKANFYSLTTSGFVPSRTWSFVDLTSQIAQGVNDSQREGDSIKLMDLDFTYNVTKIAGTSNSETFRLVIIRTVDEQVAVSDVFVDDATVLSPYSMFQWDTRKQYEVLYDETIELYAHAIDTAPRFFGNSVTRRLHLKLNNHTQFFNNSTVVDKGAIQWFCCSSQSVSDSLLIVNSRLSYVDN